MNTDDFFHEIENMSDCSTSIIEKIKSHNLPVVIFGAGAYAKVTARILKKFGVKIFGYAVDSQYYNFAKVDLSNNDSGEVLNFDTLSLEPEKYVFVVGMDDECYDGDRTFNLLKNEKLNMYAIVGGTPLTKKYILDNKAKFFETYNMLSDDWSKQTLIAYLKLCITHDPSHIYKFARKHQYFNELTKDVLSTTGSYIDCGAYRGDTIEKYIGSGGKYNKIFAIEADPQNFIELEKFIHSKGYENVLPFNCGAGDMNGTLNFNIQASKSSSFSKSGTEIEVKKIDSLVGEEKIKFIKMDIEGSELSALKGAELTIKRDRPALAICVYHKAEDLITIPQFIKSLYEGYRFYLVPHSLVSSTEFVLYAFS